MRAFRQTRIAAVVWTYNRYPVLDECLRNILGQTRLPDIVIVVDNHSSDGTAASVRRHYPCVEVLEMPINAGVGAAAAAGMRRAFQKGAEWVWLVEDDSLYPSETLAHGLDLIEKLTLGGTRAELVGMIGWQCRRLKLGLWKPFTAQERADTVLLDGSLVHNSLVQSIGYPRDDFFMMIDDIEYGLRATTNGHAVWCSAALRGHPRRLGSQSQSIWRAYYQTRNHARMILDYHSAYLGLGFMLRLSRQLGRCLLRRRKGIVEARLRLRGLRDALRNRMGKVVEPT